ncbi:MAG: capsular biosynthesis protein [Bacteroidetes bacterium]|nr:capsular biosynthesis protein [Bacteroidota bacterium]
MHSHLIPGIDDGSESVEDSIELIRSFYNLGYKKIITTPHIMFDFFKNTPEIIFKNLENLKNAVAKEQIPIKIEAAAEYMLDEGFIQKFRAGELLTFGKKYVLIELSAYFPPDSIYQVMFDLKLDGYNPILAHPERYAYWYSDFEKFVTLKDREILFQINLPSLAGYYSAEVRKIAEKFIDNNMVDFVGSDTHNSVYFEQLEKSRYSKHLEKLINSGMLKNKEL